LSEHTITVELCMKSSVLNRDRKMGSENSLCDLRDYFKAVRGAPPSPCRQRFLLSLEISITSFDNDEIYGIPLKIL
jgi:hypothetical protein